MAPPIPWSALLQPLGSGTPVQVCGRHARLDTPICWILPIPFVPILGTFVCRFWFCRPYRSHQIQRYQSGPFLHEAQPDGRPCLPLNRLSARRLYSDRLLFVDLRLHFRARVSPPILLMYEVNHHPFADSCLFGTDTETLLRGKDCLLLFGVTIRPFCLWIYRIRSRSRGNDVLSLCECAWRFQIYDSIDIQLQKCREWRLYIPMAATLLSSRLLHLQRFNPSPLKSLYDKTFPYPETELIPASKDQTERWSTERAVYRPRYAFEAKVGHHDLPSLQKVPITVWRKGNTQKQRDQSKILQTFQGRLPSPQDVSESLLQRRGYRPRYLSFCLLQKGGRHGHLRRREIGTAIGGERKAGRPGEGGSGQDASERIFTDGKVKGNRG